MDFTLLLLAFFFSFISVFVASVSGDDAAHFRVCSETFDCGTKTNLSYPFWATNYRPQECGHPDFELLGCGETNQHPILITEPLQLRLLAVNQPSKTLTVALRDLWDQICPPINGTMTLNFSLLQFAPPLSDPALQNLTLFYGCSRPPPRSGAGIPLETTLPCSDTFSFYANETFLRESGLEEALEPCRGRVEFPIPADVPAGIWGSGGEKELRGVLDAGFNVSYSYGRYEALCERCEGSNGLCGTAAGPSFMCHCVAGSRPLICSESGKRPNVPVKVAIGVGTGVGSVVIMLILFLIYLRRRRQQQYSASTSSWLSRSILSDPSSKVELEKGTSKYFGLHVFSYAELEEATNNFDSVNELGDGGFGTVYYGKLKDGRAVAVKRLYESNCKRVEQFMNEIEILTRLRHPNLVSLYGCTSRHSRELLLVYEYISNGTVADHLHGEMAKPGALPWSTRMSIAVDTASALAYLHASEIIHRDVKTNNILLDENFVVKVADFGLSRLFPTHATHVSTAPQGTPGYVDPEYHQCYQLTSRSDVFSFGVVLVELISSMPAVDITRHRHEINLSNLAINKIQGDALHELVDHSLGFQSDASIRKMMTAVAELAFQCLQSDKDLRPSMDEVLSTLQGIQRVGDDSKKGIKVPQDVRSDDAVLLKSVVVQPLPLSPDSVTGKWLSVNTTPNTSS